MGMMVTRLNYNALGRVYFFFFVLSAAINIILVIFARCLIDSVKNLLVDRKFTPLPKLFQAPIHIADKWLLSGMSIFMLLNVLL